MTDMACKFRACALALAALSLDGSWSFRFEEGVAARDVKGAAFEPTDVMTVPGCFDAMPKWLMKRGTGLYSRMFSLDRAVESAGIVIDGIGLYGRFWVDGREIGTDDLPWSRVELSVGPLAAGEHTVVAAVDNRFDWSYQKLVRPFYDFHCWGGFFRGVSLSLDARRLLVRTKDFRTGEIEVEVQNFGRRDFAATLVFDSRHKVPVTFADGRARVKVPECRLWSPESPNLHTLSLAVDGRPVAARFGVRTVEARDGGIFLNGERIFLKGANRHEQHVEFGAATPEALMLQDIQNLKAMGGNFIRGAHYPQSGRFLDLCDEMGVLVWEESLGWGNGQRYTRQGGVDELVDPSFADAQVRQTRLMVRNDFNHPSVIIFGFLNECASDRPECKDLVDRLIGTIRAEDSGRLVTFACNMCEGDICNENTDLVAFNTYPGTINGCPGVPEELREKIRGMKGYGINWLAEHFRKKYPKKTIIVSEIGVGGLYGARDVSAPFVTEDFQTEHNRIVVETVWANREIAGLSYWQLFDTRTCWRDCGYDGKKGRAMSNAGLFDAYRRPKGTVPVIADYFRNKVPANMK